MTDEERIERLENKQKEALSRWRAIEKQLLQERLNAENAELLSKFKKVWFIELKAAEARLKELKEKTSNEIYRNIKIKRYVGKSKYTV